MINIIITFDDGNKINTKINCDLEEAKRYYIGNYFNFGIDTDLMVKAIDVKEVYLND